VTREFLVKITKLNKIVSALRSLRGLMGPGRAVGDNVMQLVAQTKRKLEETSEKAEDRYRVQLCLEDK
jgi:hypothetical protein